MGALQQDLADALGVPVEEAQLLVEDAGLPREADCPHCGWPTWEHRPGEIRKDGCPYV